MRLDLIILSTSLIFSSPIWAGTSSDSDDSSDLIPRRRANSNPLSGSQEGLLSRSITPVFVLPSLREILETGEHRDHQGKLWKLQTSQKKITTLKKELTTPNGEIEARFTSAQKKDGKWVRNFKLGRKEGDTFTYLDMTLTFQEE